MSPTTLIWLKWAGLGCCAAAAVAALAAGLADRDAVLVRSWRGYCDVLDRRLRLLFIRTSAPTIAGAQAVASISIASLAVTHHVPGWWLGVGATLAAPGWVLARLRRRRTAALQRQLDGFLLTLANALRVTPNVAAALAPLPALLTSPMRQEVELVNRELLLGSSLDDALLGMSRRAGVPGLDAALTALLVGRTLGGNLPGVLTATAAAVREISRLEGVVKARTSEARAQLWVLALSPFVIVALVAALSPRYFEPLQSSALGAALALGAGVLWLLSLLLARDVLEVNP